MNRALSKWSARAGPGVLRYGCRGWAQTAMVAAFALLGALPTAGAGQVMDLPADVQASVLSRIFAFDRRFHDRVGEEVVLAVAYQRFNRDSRNALQDLTRALEGLASQRFEGLPYRILPLDLESEDVDSVLVREKVDLVYLTPLRSVDIAGLAAAWHAAGVPTMSGVSGYVQEGVAVTVGRRGERPEIVINLLASREAGVDFTAQILELARVVRESSP